MSWRIFQALIVGAVLSANVYWQWTPNGYLAAIWAGMAALALTWLLSKAIDLWRGWRQRRATLIGHKRGDDRSRSRIIRR